MSVQYVMSPSRLEVFKVIASLMFDESSFKTIAPCKAIEYLRVFFLGKILDWLRVKC